MFKFTIRCSNQILIFRDERGMQSIYEPVAVISHSGDLTEEGISYGHYTCDIKHHVSGLWYKTNDGKNPRRIKLADVSKHGYVILYKKS